MHRYAVMYVALVICLIRLFISPHELSLVGSYTAVAHLFVGGIIGAAIVSKELRKPLVWLAVLMSVWEVAVSVISRM